MPPDILKELARRKLEEIAEIRKQQEEKANGNGTDGAE
jgi:hypothetical protein